MSAAHRRVFPVAVLLAGLMTAGCTAKDPAPAPAAAAALHVADIVAVKGLQAEGDGPTLSWQSFAGAATYSVTVTGGETSWLWAGPQTEVLFGIVSANPQTDFQLDTPPEQIVAPVGGTTYRWFVTALDADGQPIGISDDATFEY